MKSAGFKQMQRQETVPIGVSSLFIEAGNGTINKLPTAEHDISMCHTDDKSQELEGS